MFQLAGMLKPLSIPALLSKYPLISDQVDRTELAVILSELSKHADELHENSSVVEFGCYLGTTSLFIRRLLDSLGANTSFHVYDSFAGLPDKNIKDFSPAGEQFKTGELSASRKDFEMQFKKAGLKLPKIHKAWFSELRDDDIPGTIVFAYLDGDYYESIQHSLLRIEEKLSQGATIVIDDYSNEALPGAAKAVDEWLIGKDFTLRVESSLAILTRKAR